MSIQAGIGYLLTFDRPQIRRHIFPLFITGILAAYGIIDYCVGAATDWWHFAHGTNQGTLYILDYVCAYLLVNAAYQAYVRPLDYSMITDCCGPIILSAVAQYLRLSPFMDALRPLLVGFLPTAVASSKQHDHLDWHLVLWTRVAAPAYALRFLPVSDVIWWSYSGWVGWNMSWLLVKCIGKKDTLLE